MKVAWDWKGVVVFGVAFAATAALVYLDKADVSVLAPLFVAGFGRAPITLGR